MPTAPSVFRPHGKRADVDRGSARERGYTVQWDKAAAADRAEHPLCVGCEAVGRVKAARVTDHIVPHKGDTQLMWDKANWQSCCDWHHNVVKKRLEAEYFEGKIGASDLRLTSPRAIRLTRLLARGEGEVKSLGP